MSSSSRHFSRHTSRTARQAGNTVKSTVPTPAGTDGHWRIRDDRINKSGVVTLRYNSKLHHIRIGRAHKGERIRLLIHNRAIRIINTRTGELLRELTLDPTIDL